MDLAELRRRLSAHHQEKTLRFVEQLPEAGKKKLLGQLGAIDLDSISKLIKEYVAQKPHLALPKDIRPVKVYPRRPTGELRELYEKARERGMQLVRDGKVAAFLVAGGQGTRLGYDGPKGEFPITPIKNKPLFQVFAEQLRAWGSEVGRSIPWYIMTSDINDAATREFFKKNKFFGCEPRDVFFFEQGMMPAFAMSGEMLLAEKDSLALSPDGHGGSLRALFKSGALADMKKRGIEQLSYFQVDNPMVHCIDPLFIGLHELTGSEMASKVLPKSSALEKVGNFVVADGKTQVIEYSDMPEDLAKHTAADGSLKFNAGSIAIHGLAVSFVERLNLGGQLKLPWHRAEKKVAYIDDSGREVKPEKPNAIKLEQFVFDAIPLAKNPLVYETDREEEFSPVKNAEGADSPETCRRDQIRRAARWLEGAGVRVAEDAVVEISPLFAERAEQLKGKRLPKEIKSGEKIYFGD
ncbi:MAG TPA: UDPGP type 1 family protein [Tepidisphaeraceae bacterium]|jgi:UDP-N-acetylglucosamine/UDP-N-acetylgalactosamine diphosphorylase|nr:UDPGP type 1 family protein [Tepidisphaeraceae bacterium]